MAHTEIELKLLLDTEHDYAALRQWLEAAGEVKVVEQDNRYLDTTDRLFAGRRLMLRVRVAGDKVKCTAKSGAQLVDGVMRVSEWEAAVPDAEAWRTGRSSCALRALPEPVIGGLASGPLADVDDLGDRVVHVIGAMKNTRRKCYVPYAALGLSGEGTLCLELDHTLFPARQERFELEVEHDDAAALQSAIQGLLDRLDVSWRPASGSKYEQFLSALAEEQGDPDELI